MNSLGLLDNVLRCALEDFSLVLKLIIRVGGVLNHGV